MEVFSQTKSSRFFMFLQHLFTNKNTNTRILILLNKRFVQNLLSSKSSVCILFFTKIISDTLLFSIRNVLFIKPRLVLVKIKNNVIEFREVSIRLPAWFASFVLKILIDHQGFCPIHLYDLNLPVHIRSPWVYLTCLLFAFTENYFLFGVGL